MKRLTEEHAANCRKWLERVCAVVVAAILTFTLTAVGQSFWNRANRDAGFNDLTGESGLVEVHVIDVGKADAILLRSGGSAALLDAGKAPAGEVVADYLARYGVESLDYVIMSHPDKDHIGGMSQVLEEIPAKTFVQAPLPEEVIPDSDEYRAMEQAVDDNGLERAVLLPGETLTLGAARLTALGPLREYGDANNNSLVLQLTCGKFAALFCGDMEKEAERDLLSSGEDLSADLLKVGHHGSKTSTTEEFLAAVSPSAAAVSVGPDRNNLPREEVLERLEYAGVQIYRTDTDGDIVFAYDGNYLSINTEK